jgi:hypothetical protein
MNTDKKSCVEWRYLSLFVLGGWGKIEWLYESWESGAVRRCTDWTGAQTGTARFFVKREDP